MILANPPLATKLHILKRRIQNPVADRYAVTTLLGVAVVSTLIYGLMFARPFNLFALQDRPLFDLARYAKNDASIVWKQILAFGALGGLYWLGWRAALRARGRAAWTIVLSSAVLFGVLLLFTFPYDAADLFDNIMHGRIISVYRANPFKDVAAQFNSDPFYPYTAWRNSVSAYGPAWEMLAGFVTRLAGNSFIANVLAFKLMLGGFLAAGAALVVMILRRLAPERALAGLVLLVWNPIVLVETIGNGHNDLAMMIWVLLAAWLLQRRRYSPSVLALLVGALIKYIPLLLLPIVLAIALRDLPNHRTRVRFAIVTTVAAVTLIAAAYAPFWRGLDTLSIERRANLLTTSLPSLIYFQLKSNISNDEAIKLVSLTAAGLTVAFSLAMAVRAWRDRSELSFARSAFYLLMFYLLLTCLWFQPWYAVWPLALAALLPPGHAARLAVLFGYTALSKELIFGPLLLWQRPLPPQMWRETLLGPLVMSMAWSYAIVALWDTWRKRRRSRSVGALDRRELAP